jgi:hypothetical protein
MFGAYFSKIYRKHTKFYEIPKFIYLGKFSFENLAFFLFENFAFFETAYGQI